jgi:hypothetical protein
LLDDPRPFARLRAMDLVTLEEVAHVGA